MNTKMLRRSSSDRTHFSVIDDDFPNTLETTCCDEREEAGFQKDYDRLFSPRAIASTMHASRCLY